MTGPATVWGSHPTHGSFLQTTLLHCKTLKASMTVAAVGRSYSGIVTVDYLKQYVELTGMQTIATMVDGLPCQTLDYYVARVWVLGWTPATLTKALAALPSWARATRSTARLLLRELKTRARSRHKELRYLNVMGGTMREVQLAVRAMRRRGVVAHLVAGPLIRDLAQDGRLTHMPMKAARISNQIRKVLVAEGLHQGKPMVKPSGHCTRRGATEAAREAQAAGRLVCGAHDIDLHFKWGLKKLRKEMQLYYAGLRPLLERLNLSAHL
jgi:hypothetical protein